MRIPLVIKIAALLGVFVWSLALFASDYKEQQVYLHGRTIKVKVDDIEYGKYRANRKQRKTLVDFQYKNKFHRVKMHTAYADNLQPGDTIVLKHLPGNSYFTPVSGYDNHFLKEYISGAIIFLFFEGFLIWFFLKFSF